MSNSVSRTIAYSYSDLRSASCAKSCSLCVIFSWMASRCLRKSSIWRSRLSSTIYFSFYNYLLNSSRFLFK
jgi:hypothetical protein